MRLGRLNTALGGASPPRSSLIFRHSLRSYDWDDWEKAPEAIEELELIVNVPDALVISPFETVNAPVNAITLGVITLVPEEIV